MGGRSSRVKGHSYEREVAILLRPVFPDACRLLEYQEGLGVDIANTGPFRFQCKRNKGYAPLSKMYEAEDGVGIPVLVTKADRKDALVALKLSDFLDLLNCWKEKNGGNHVQEDAPGRGTSEGGRREAGDAAPDECETAS